MGALVTLIHAKQENGDPLVKRGEIFVQIMTMHWLNGSAKSLVVIVQVSKQIFVFPL